MDSGKHPACHCLAPTMASAHQGLVKYMQQCLCSGMLVFTSLRGLSLSCPHLQGHRLFEVDLIAWPPKTNISWSNPFCPAPRFTQTPFDRGLLDLASCLTVEDWLDSIRLGHYRDNFAMAGYSSLGMVMRMNVE